MTNHISKRCESCEVIFNTLHEKTTRCNRCALGNQSYPVLCTLSHLYEEAKEKVRRQESLHGQERADAFERVNKGLATVAEALGYPTLTHFSRHLAKRRKEKQTPEG